MTYSNGDEVFFTATTHRPGGAGREVELFGRVLRVNPDGTVTVQSASGLMTFTVPAGKVSPAYDEDRKR